MILWWSNCSASMTVSIQLFSSVIWIVYDEKRRFVEAASSTFEKKIIYKCITWKRMNCIQWNITNGKEVNAVENVSTYAHTYKLTSCWSIYNDWSYVDSLGLNACKWVALRTGMNLFLWCGLVLFRLDETTQTHFIITYIHLYVCMLMVMLSTLVIMKWFHLTLLWK